MSTKTKAPAPAKTPAKGKRAAPSFLDGVFAAPAKVQAAAKGIPSTVGSPVGVTWGIGIYLSMQGDTPSLPSRATLVVAAVEAGVNAYTARTQAHRFRQWAMGGRDPRDVPRGVIVPEGLPSE